MQNVTKRNIGDPNNRSREGPKKAIIAINSYNS